ncbi:MAG: hypothetical protein V4540_14800 [Pseudomonadota bacterium]
MKRSLQGRYVKVAAAGEPFKPFVPAPLPPRPAIERSPALRGRFDATQRRSSGEALAVAGHEVRAVRAARRKA